MRGRDASATRNRLLCFWGDGASALSAERGGLDADATRVLGDVVFNARKTLSHRLRIAPEEVAECRRQPRRCELAGVDKFRSGPERDGACRLGLVEPGIDQKA